MKFSELDDFAKGRARADAQSFLEHDEWWRYIYADAQRAAALLGIAIDCDPRGAPLIHFDDRAATFAGRYEFAPDAVKSIVAYAPTDMVLHRLAAELTTFGVELRIKYGDVPRADIVNGSQMDVSMWADVFASTIVVPFDIYEMERRLTDLLKDFGVWIKARLDEEETYRLSDECIDEELSQHEFDVHGSII